MNSPSTANRGCMIALVALVVVVIGCFLIPHVLLPKLGIGMALPVISVPGEQIPGTPLTNTLVGTLLADVVVLALVLLAVRNVKEVPGRLQSVVELIASFLDNLARSVAGANARKIFPLAATIFMFVLVANWLELIPGVDSIGVLECAPAGLSGYPATGSALTVVRSLDPGKVATKEDFEACEKVGHGEKLSDEEQKRIDVTAKLDADAKATLSAEEQALAKKPLRSGLHVVTSFVRAAATDLNMTLAIAVIAFLAIQYYGIQANGGSYFYKFINIPALDNIGNPKKPMMGALGPIDFAVGFLEIISELAKILSFGFRLFGNVFAGQVLLFVMTFLVATVLPIVFYGLELFVGAIQAFVFAMLVLVFSAMAMAGHHDDSHDDHGDDHEHAAAH